MDKRRIIPKVVAVGVLIAFGIWMAPIEWSPDSPILLLCRIIMVPALMIGILAVPISTARWILRPLDEAAKRSRMRMQFTLLDFLCLFVIVQAPMALIHGLADYTPAGMIAVFDVFAWFCVGTMWFGSVWAMSRAGVERPADRCVFLVVVLPLSIVTVIASPASMIFLLPAFAWRELPQERLLPVAALAGALAGALAVVFPCGLFTRRMVARATPPLTAEEALPVPPAAEKA